VEGGAVWADEKISWAGRDAVAQLVYTALVVSEVARAGAKAESLHSVTSKEWRQVEHAYKDS
jgi:hypothetical protein